MRGRSHAIARATAYSLLLLLLLLLLLDRRLLEL